MKRNPAPLERREFLKMCAAWTATSALPGSAFAGTDGVFQDSKVSGEDEVDLFIEAIQPTVGTGWHGHTFPGAVVPFGLVQLSPDTSGPPARRRGGERDNYAWDHSSGYHFSDNVVIGFSHTHLQGTGGVDLGDVLLMPVIEGRNWSWNAGIPGDQAQEQAEALGPDSGWIFADDEGGYRSFFSHEREVARAGYYSVHLQTPDVRAELTATTRCGMHRYTYPTLPPGTRHGVLLDLVHGLGSRVYHAELNIESASRISGRRCTRGWASDREVYFVVELSQPMVSLEARLDGTATTVFSGAKFCGERIQLRFCHALSPQPLKIRVGLSCTSIEGASKNLAAEIAHWDFDATVRESERRWLQAFESLNAEVADAALARTFQTAHYHGLIAPATFNDVDGTYRGQDRRNHAPSGFTKYTTLSIWDIHRGQFPLVMLTQPTERTEDIVKTMLADYDQLALHSLPLWTLWGNETWSMRPGFHAAAMILGAYECGFRGFDVETAYAAVRDTALVGPETKDTRAIRERFRRFGYCPAGASASVSGTLDLAYDYWCAGAMADRLGKQDDAAMFYKLGQSYKNIFDPVSGFMRGKTEAAGWTEPFRPDQELPDYVESDAWQATFSVPHDVQGLIGLFGGEAPFVARLDELFSASSNVIDARPDISGMIGQDAQGNEPSQHIPYLYAFAGAPWKTQYWVRRVAALYNSTPAGIPGNDDCGQLSSWFVFSALGFYPLNPATGVYVIGSPLIRRGRIINPATRAVFTIVGENNSQENVFIQSVKLNGTELSKAWLTHADLAAGGELHFRMGNKPNKEWGSARADYPPSGLLPRR